MKTRSAKAKGRRLQNEVTQILTKKFNNKGYSFKPAIMGEQGEDIKIYPNTFPFSFECKNKETINIWEAYKQAQQNSNKKIPILIFKRNRSEIYVMMKLTDWLEYVNEEKI